tara:strand:- start:65 stop:280 length:216 start_codon:yes stop_codon:yes gene_type:complete
MKSLLDESYISLKKFTENNELSEEELKDLDDFIKSLSEQLESIETNKNKNLIVKLGKTFKYLIEKENKNDN